MNVLYCATFATFLIFCSLTKADDLSLSNEITDDHLEKVSDAPLTTGMETVGKSEPASIVELVSLRDEPNDDLRLSEALAESVPSSSSSTSVPTTTIATSSVSADSTTTISTTAKNSSSTLNNNSKPSSNQPNLSTGSLPANGVINIAAGQPPVFRVLSPSSNHVRPYLSPSSSVRPTLTSGRPVSSSPSPSPSPVFSRQGKCSCFAESTTIVRYYRAFDEQLQLGESAILNCNNPLDATLHCEKLCKNKAVTEFNEEIDLRQTFSGQPDKRIGQALCTQLGSVLVPTYMRVKSHTVCFGQGWSVARDTGLRSKARFMCVLGRFQTVL